MDLLKDIAKERQRQNFDNYVTRELLGDNHYYTFCLYCHAENKDKQSEAEFKIYLTKNNISLTGVQKRNILIKHFNWKQEIIKSEFILTKGNSKINFTKNGDKLFS